MREVGKVLHKVFLVCIALLSTRVAKTESEEARYCHHTWLHLVQKLPGRHIFVSRQYQDAPVVLVSNEVVAQWTAPLGTKMSHETGAHVHRGALFHPAATSRVVEADGRKAGFFQPFAAGLVAQPATHLGPFLRQPAVVTQNGQVVARAQRVRPPTTTQHWTSSSQPGGARVQVRTILPLAFRFTGELGANTWQLPQCRIWSSGRDDRAWSSKGTTGGFRLSARRYGGINGFFIRRPGGAERWGLLRFTKTCRLCHALLFCLQFVALSKCYKCFGIGNPQGRSFLLQFACYPRACGWQGPHPFLTWCFRRLLRVRVRVSPVSLPYQIRMMGSHVRHPVQLSVCATDELFDILQTFFLVPGTLPSIGDSDVAWALVHHSAWLLTCSNLQGMHASA